ncbi:MAG: hypothetical protein EPO27_09825 [Betaproteobacteria bacterium]|nr:MAG: hypothetical protein EPO27_09825 [Betaproteobacteria bacterium]
MRGERALNTITGYGAGFVLVNNARHESSLIVLPERIVPWVIDGFEALALADFERLAGLDLEIVLLGTGARLRFPRPELTRPLLAARIGLEVMDFQAACRTYNLLMAESRKVAAALLLE